MYTLIAIVVVVALTIVAWVRSDAHNRSLNLFMCMGLACAVLICTYTQAEYAAQEAAYQAEVQASVEVRTKLVNKFSPQTQEQLLDVFKNTYLAKVDRTCALALIISAKYAIKHKKPAYEGCGFTSADFIAIGVMFPHK